MAIFQNTTSSKLISQPSFVKKSPLFFLICWFIYLSSIWIHPFLQWVIICNLFWCLKYQMLTIGELLQAAPMFSGHITVSFLSTFFTFWDKRTFQAHLASSLPQSCNHPFLQEAPWVLLVGHGRLPISLFSDLSSLVFFKKQICVCFYFLPQFLHYKIAYRTFSFAFCFFA